MVAGREDTGEHADIAPAGPEERALMDALYALNRAMPSPPPDPKNQPANDRYRRFHRVRDQVWDLGVELYGWRD